MGGISPTLTLPRSLRQPQAAAAPAAGMPPTPTPTPLPMHVGKERTHGLTNRVRALVSLKKRRYICIYICIIYICICICI